MATVGCDSRVTGTSTSSAPSAAETVSPASIGAVQQSTTQQYTVDAGVVFVDEATYRCIPLSELDIASADQIESIETSCECIEVYTIVYRKSPTEVAEALRLNVVTEGNWREMGPGEFSEASRDIRAKRMT